MYESPHEPGHKAAELNSGTLQYCEVLAYNGKIALVKIAKWRQGRAANYLTKDGFGRVLALLHRNLRDPGKWPAVLI